MSQFWKMKMYLKIVIEVRRANQSHLPYDGHTLRQGSLSVAEYQMHRIVKESRDD